MSEVSLSSELIGLIGETSFLKLVEKFGGTRLYVPSVCDTSTPVTPRWLSNGAPPKVMSLARIIGKGHAAALASYYAGSYIRVPLARELRARRYREAGNSNAQIARLLGMTETGVDKIFRRMNDKPDKGGQMDLFKSKDVA